jgi:hypothetical protein
MEPVDLVVFIVAIFCAYLLFRARRIAKERAIVEMMLGSLAPAKSERRASVEYRLGKFITTPPEEMLFKFWKPVDWTRQK